MPHENSVTVERYDIVTCARTSRPVVIALSLALDWLQARGGEEVVGLRWPLWARALTLAAVSVALVFCLRPAGAEPLFDAGC